MSSLWQRLVRLLRQSRIRLPRELGPEALCPGDRLGIGPRRWRVTRSVSAAELELAAEGAPQGARARLRYDASDPFRPWILDDAGGSVRLGGADLVHFPASALRRPVGLSRPA